MTSVSTRLIVFSILISILVGASASTSFTGQFLLDIFGNPIKDFQNTFTKEKVFPKTSSLREDPYRKKKDDNSQPKMIDVPSNAQRCQAGSYMDINGVCRQPW